MTVNLSENQAGELEVSVRFGEPPQEEPWDYVIKLVQTIPSGTDYQTGAFTWTGTNGNPQETYDSGTRIVEFCWTGSVAANFDFGGVLSYTLGTSLGSWGLETLESYVQYGNGQCLVPTGTDKSVWFPDPALRAHIESLLGTGNPPTASRLALLTKLWPINLGIEDLAGIEHCTGLSELRLDFNHIPDLSPLADDENQPLLPNLTVLAIPGDARPLYYLTGTEEDDDHRLTNEITDLSPLENYTGLVHLDLRGSNERFPVKEGDPAPSSCTGEADDALCNMDKVYGNNIHDLSPLAGLVNLEYLNLSGNRICDISALRNLNALVTLNLSNNYLGLGDDPGEGEGEGVSDVLAAADWANKTALRRLRLDFNGLDQAWGEGETEGASEGQIEGESDIASLAVLPSSLEHLDLHGNGIQDITPIPALGNLIELNLFQNCISTLENSHVPDMSSCRFLYLGRNKLNSIQSLRGESDSRPASLERLNFLDNTTNPEGEGEGEGLVEGEGEPDGEGEISTLTEQIEALRNFGVNVLTRDDYLPSCGSKSSTYYRFRLHYADGTLQVLSIQQLAGDGPTLFGPVGEHGTLELTDVNEVVTEVPVNVPLTWEIDDVDPVTGDPTGYVQMLEESTFNLDAPRTGELLTVAYVPAEGGQKSLLDKTAPEDVFGPGTPVPISCRRIWPPKEEDACDSFVFVCIGDGFAGYDPVALDPSSGDRLGSVSVVPDGQSQSDADNIPWSEAIADAWNYELQFEPLIEYQTYISVYRVDVLSEESGVTTYGANLDGSDSSYRETAFGMEFGRGRTLEGWRGDIVTGLASKLVPNYHRVLMMANGFVSGNSGDVLGITKNQFPDRHYTTAHELGHLFGPIGDEYEQTGNEETPYGYNARRPNTVLWRTPAGYGYVPHRQAGTACEVHIEWDHWLVRSDPLCESTAVLYSDCTAQPLRYCPDPAEGEGEGEGSLCSATFCAENPGELCATPLPTLVPAGTANQQTPVGLYAGGSYRSFGYRAQPRCVMRFKNIDFYCKPCREQLIMDINYKSKMIRDAHLTLEGMSLLGHVETRLPRSHSLHVEWRLDADDGTLISTDHDFVYDVSNLATGQHYLYLKVRDDAWPEGEGEPWALPGYEYQNDNEINGSRCKSANLWTYESILAESPDEPLGFIVP